MKKLLLPSLIALTVLTTGCAVDGFRDPISGEVKLNENKEKIKDFENKINAERIEKHNIKMAELEKTLKEQKVADIKAHLAKMNNPPKLVSFAESMGDDDISLKRYLQKHGVKFEKGIRSFSLVYSNPIEFDLEKAIIKREDVQTLQAIVIAFLAINDRFPIEIEVHGHADFTGPESLNGKLSQKRATNIANYLVSQGLAPSLIRGTVGHGADTPAKSCVALDCLRRVEFKIINIEEEGLLMDGDSYDMNKVYKKVN